MNLRRYISNTSGNFAIMVAIGLSMLLIAIGGAVDISNALSNKSKFQDISDAAALAGAKGLTETEMEALSTEYIENYKSSNADRFVIKDYDIRPSIQSGRRNLEVDISGAPETYFLHLIGMDMISIGVTSVVTEADSMLEIALVLDISWSMSGAKVANLRMAADEFIETMIGPNNTSANTSISIIPFGGNVNLGPILANDLMVDTSSAVLDPPDVTYRGIVFAPDKNLIASSRLRFTDGTNCIETTMDDYDVGRILSNSRSQLPAFYHANSQLRVCPEEESRVLFNSNNKAILKNRISDMVLSHGTGLDVGAMWGLKALSPSHRGVLGGNFTHRPFDFNGKSQKILVIMTDGNITGQGRPSEPNNPARLTDPNAMNNMRLLEPGTPASSSSDNDATGRFKKVCEIATANNIDVYTIGYRVTVGDSADQLLQYCASSADQYYLVESMNVSTAFQSIAKDLSQLRISH